MSTACQPQRPEEDTVAGSWTSRRPRSTAWLKSSLSPSRRTGSLSHGPPTSRMSSGGEGQLGGPPSDGTFGPAFALTGAASRHCRTTGQYGPEPMRALASFSWSSFTAELHRGLCRRDGRAVPVEGTTSEPAARRAVDVDSAACIRTRAWPRQLGGAGQTSSDRGNATRGGVGSRSLTPTTRSSRRVETTAVRFTVSRAFARRSV